MAGVARLQMPTPFRVLRVMCSGRFKPEYAFKASQYGPGAQFLDALRKQQRDVRVMVYFGSYGLLAYDFEGNVLETICIDASLGKIRWRKRCPDEASIQIVSRTFPSLW